MTTRHLCLQDSSRAEDWLGIRTWGTRSATGRDWQPAPPPLSKQGSWWAATRLSSGWYFSFAQWQREISTAQLLCDKYSASLPSSIDVRASQELPGGAAGKHSSDCNCISSAPDKTRSREHPSGVAFEFPANSHATQQQKRTAPRTRTDRTFSVDLASAQATYETRRPQHHRHPPPPAPSHPDKRRAHRSVARPPRAPDLPFVSLSATPGASHSPRDASCSKHARHGFRAQETENRGRER